MNKISIAILFNFFVLTHSAQKLEYSQTRAIELYEHILPWVGKKEVVQKAIDAAHESKQLKILELSQLNAKAVINPDKDEVTLFLKTSKKVVSCHFLLTSIDEIFPEPTSLTAHGDMSKDKKLRCIIS